MFEDIIQDYVWLKVLLLSALHFLSPYFGSILKNKSEFIHSFGGGVAAAYVFLHLLPEIDRHEFLGSMIYLFVLGGFLIYHGVEKSLENDPSIEDASGNYKLKISSYFLYNILLVLGIPHGGVDSYLTAFVLFFAVSLHLFSTNFEFISEYKDRFIKSGRYIVILGLFVGVFFRNIVVIDDEVIRDVITAVLAGSVIYSVFKNEIPDRKGSKYHMFLIGVAIFIVIFLIVPE